MEKNPLRNGMRLNDLPGKYASDNIPIHQILAENGYQVAHIGVNHISLRPPLKERLDFAAWEDDDTFAAFRKEAGLPVSRKQEDTVVVSEYGDGMFRDKRYSNARVSLWDNREDLFKDVRITLPANIGIPAKREPASRRLGAAAKLALTPPEGGWEEGMRAHYALTRLCDDQFSRIRQALEECGEWENTMVVFTADHGEHMGQHNMYQKMEMYETAVHVPGVIKLPRGRDNNIINTPVSHLDILPTILDSLDIKSQETTEGCSLKSVILNGGEPPFRDIMQLWPNGRKRMATMCPNE